MNKQLATRFLRYVNIDTQSDASSTTCPSTGKQFNLVKLLADELVDMGVTKVNVDQNGYLFATIPANTTKQVPVIGFIAHVDTSPDMSGNNIKPRIVENYAGADIVLNERDGIILSPSDSPELLNYIGNDLVVTDGHTLLGADDKSGITAIMLMAEFLVSHPEFEHGTVKIGFTPDEEIGRGADLFNVENFGADYAYTIDGEGLGAIEFENFNAASAIFDVKGREVHPGSGKDKMVNACLMLARIIGSIPVDQTPRYTDGYQGFFHTHTIEGNVEHAHAEMLIRDHDSNKFQQKKDWLKETVSALCNEYGGEYISLTITDQYKNMREKIEPHMHLIETAMEAMRQIGIEPKVSPIRGGTDGARLSYMGLPTPNIFAGGHNFHSRYEYVPLQSIEKASQTILKIIELYAAK